MHRFTDTLRRTKNKKIRFTEEESNNKPCRLPFNNNNDDDNNNNKDASPQRRRRKALN